VAVVEVLDAVEVAYYNDLSGILPLPDPNAPIIPLIFGTYQDGVGYVEFVSGSI
jgi:hypothetical protein